METPQEAKLSPVEKIKSESRQLRGTIKESLAAPTTHFSKDDNALLKSHGSYEQDDRDKRQQLLKEKKEPAYSIMVRSKIVGGRMTAEQYLVHDELATRYGNNTLRITTRQGLQFHGVLKQNMKAVVRGINEKLGTTLGACGDNVRNVMACPAPHADRRQSEIMKYAKTLSDHFLSRSGAYQEIWLDGELMPHIPKPETGPNPEPIYGKTYLPRKFKIAIAFPDDNCTDIYSNDLGIAPEIASGKLKGFNILVGGGFGMTHGVATTYPRLATPFCFVAPEDLTKICEAIVLVQRDFGNRADRKRARMKYLIDERGLDWFRAEVEKRFGKKTDAPHAYRPGAIETHLGWHEQGGGLWFLGLSVENGRIQDKGGMKLKSGLKAAVDKYRPEVYLTAQQDILLANLREGQKQELEALLGSYGIPMPGRLSLIQKDSMACPALPTCGLAIAESERVLPTIIDQLEALAAQLGLADQRLMVRMTGCPNGCARPYNAEIAFVGRTVGTYAVFLGGSLQGDRLNFLYGDKVPEAQLAEYLTPLLRLYKQKRFEGEGFGDFCHRLGAENLRSEAALIKK